MGECDVGEQRKANDIYGSSGLILKFMFQWIVVTLAMVFTNALIISNSSWINNASKGL